MDTYSYRVTVAIRGDKKDGFGGMVVIIDRGKMLMLLGKRCVMK